MTDVLLIERTPAAMRLTLNRPDKRNALSRELISLLTAALQKAVHTDGVRCVVIRGAGPAFCAGLDLREMAQSTPEQAEQDSLALTALFETVDNLPLPVIAVLAGPAVAGGAGLASVCDIVLCARGASIGYPEIKRGLVAALVMTYLRRLVGERRAKHLLLTGESLAAEDALACGLGTEVVDDGALAQRTEHYEQLFASLPPGPLAQTKALWSRIRPLSHADAIREARALNAAMRTSSDSRAGAEAFLKGP